jgi:hypothetical protein
MSREFEDTFGDNCAYGGSGPWWLCRFLDGHTCPACGAGDLAAHGPVTYLECDGPHLRFLGGLRVPSGYNADHFQSGNPQETPMKGYNAEFMKKPFEFAQTYPLNNMSMRSENSDSVGQTTSTRNLDLLATLGKGYFDLQPEAAMGIENIYLTPILGGTVPTGLGAEPLIEAYFVGYLAPGPQGAGTANIPYVDMPAINPPVKYMFTGGMQGCSLVVTQQPGGIIRVWHDSVHGGMTFAGHTVVLRLDYDHSNGATSIYGIQHVYGVNNPGEVPGAFNFMYYNAPIRHWILVCQPHVYVTTFSTYNPRRVAIKPNAALQPFQLMVP